MLRDYVISHGPLDLSSLYKVLIVLKFKGYLEVKSKLTLKLVLAVNFNVEAKITFSSAQILPGKT